MNNIVELRWPETSAEEMESFAAAIQYMSVEALKLGYEDAAIYLELARQNLPKSTAESKTPAQ